MLPAALDEEESRALALDAADPLSACRDAFLIPPHGTGEQVYFCGNSLGLQPRAVRAALDAELEHWARRAVAGHFEGAQPWLDIQEELQPMLAPIVGAAPADVVVMNALSVNLQLLLSSFYRPHGARRAILIEQGAFPSDRHVAVSHLAWHGLGEDALIEVAPDARGLFATAAFAEVFARQGDRIALALLPGVQYRNGQVFDIATLTELAHRHGAMACFDLAHAVGNVPLRLADWNVDCAAWCSYKYLNGGPGAPGGVFVHARHAGRARLAGWWGHAKATRFRMAPEFTPEAAAAGWQLSNPPVLALAPLRASLEPFARLGMPALRERALRLTGYLDALLRRHAGDALEILTPSATSERGCQLSLRVRAGREAGHSLFAHLLAHGVVGDWREPDVIRLAPVPLYNRHTDCLRAVRAILDWTRGLSRRSASAGARDAPARPG